MNIAKILVVDDNKSTVKAIKENLEKANFSVLEALGGQEAIEILGKEKADLMTLDLYMPKVSGTEVLKWLRSNQDLKLKELPVVIISAQPEINKAFHPTPNTYLFSDKGIDKLIAQIRTLLKLE